MDLWFDDDKRCNSFPKNNDKDGIIWPISIAPFEVHVLPTNVSDPELKEAAESIYEGLTGLGIQVLLDDRDERPGNKFKDADLVGTPIRVTVGEKSLKEGKVELRMRATGEVVKIEKGDAVARIAEVVKEEKKKLEV